MRPVKILLLSISGPTQPGTLPVSVLTWQVLCVSLLSQFAQKRLSGITGISQGSGLLLVLHHSLHSMLVVLCSIGLVTHTQKHQITSVPLTLTQGSFIPNISLSVSHETFR